MIAFYPGFCQECGQDIIVGSEISKFGYNWVHTECKKNRIEVNKILGGDTFRSQAPSRYRRKAKHK